MVPVVLLTGFLGSGKTTLLNRFLRLPRDPGAGKLAILVNELGSVGIDASLLPPGAARQVELPGGCICCTLDENLEKSLVELIDAEPALALVVIETTGIAEPLPILWTLGGEGLAERLRVAAVVTVVDALEHERHRPLAPAVDAQVEHADILVLSKLDLAGPARAAELTRLLRTQSPSSALVAEPGPAESAAALARLLADPELARTPTHGHAHRHADGHGFETLALPIVGTLDFEELSARLEELPAGYVRIKGICHAIDRSTGSDEARWIAFHRVGARVSAEPLPPGGETPAPRVVALGAGLDADRLASCLRAAVIPFQS
jgi:G3E family GTPase